MTPAAEMPTEPTTEHLLLACNFVIVGSMPGSNADLVARALKSRLSAPPPSAAPPSNKIVEGLKEAVAYAQGDETKGHKAVYHVFLDGLTAAISKERLGEIRKRSDALNKIEMPAPSPGHEARVLLAELLAALSAPVGEKSP